MDIDFKNMETYRWFLVGGGALTILAVLLYLLKGSGIRVSAFFACFIGCLVLGFGLGVITLGSVGYNWNKKEDEADPTRTAQGGNPKKDNPGTKKDNAGKRDGFGKGFQGKGKGGPDVKAQLATLIGKLNLLTETPLTVNLDDERKKKIGDVLESLGVSESLDDKEAAKAVVALQEILEGDRKAMTAVGYNWFNGSADTIAAKTGNNPFAKGNDRSALASVLQRAGKKIPDLKPKEDPKSKEVEVLPEPRTVEPKGGN